LRQGRWTAAEDAQLETYLASHPDERTFWDEELHLNQLLSQTPDAPVSSNFTARVLQAIRSGPLQAIAVTMFQWTGPSQQARILDWMVIEDAASAAAAAAAIAATPRQLFRGGTSISGALDYATRLFPDSGLASERRVIDVSGDGANNIGRPAAAARDAAVAAGIVINGLPILALEPDLERYYRDNVIGGPGAFVVAVDSFDHFGAAILNKLISEIAAMPAPAFRQEVQAR